jgi:hypothetical protein
LFYEVIREYQRRDISDIMMGVETPMPPVRMNPAAPDGAPPRRINRIKCPEKLKISGKNATLPRRASERP